MNFQPFPPSSVNLFGEIRKHMELTAEKILHHIDIDSVFASHYRNRCEKPSVPGGFTGYGMFLDAVVKAAAHGIGGAEMVEFKEKRLAEIIRTQSEDGNISIFSGAPGYWDNHDQAYLIQAFVNDSRFFHCGESLSAARNLGEFLLNIRTKMNLGLETAFLMLSQESGDERFRNYCRDEFKITESLEVYDRMLSVNNIAHVYTDIARVLAQLQYSLLTGDRNPVLFDGARELYRKIFSDYSSISGSCTGGSIWGELWDASQIGRGRWGETCASAYLLRCTAKMFEIQPSSRLGDLYERVMYNALFGAQSGDGLKTRYFIPFEESGEWYDRESYCCPNNFRRIVFELPDAVYFKTSDSVAVNLYTDSELCAEGIRIRQETAYPESGRVEITVETEKPTVLQFRIPLWCASCSLRLNGETRYPAGGDWFRVELPAAEKYALSLHFEMPVRVVRGRNAQVHRGALMRGPLVYAFRSEENGMKKLGQNLDLLEIDNTLPMTVTDSGIRAVCRIPYRLHPVKEECFIRFSSENRARTYFALTSERDAVPDELYSPEFQDVNKIEIEK